MLVAFKEGDDLVHRRGSQPLGQCLGEFPAIRRHGHDRSRDPQVGGSRLPCPIRPEPVEDNRGLLAHPCTLTVEDGPFDRVLVRQSVTIGQERDDRVGVVDRAGRVALLGAKPDQRLVIPIGEQDAPVAGIGILDELVDLLPEQLPSKRVFRVLLETREFWLRDHRRGLLIGRSDRHRTRTLPRLDRDSGMLSTRMAGHGRRMTRACPPARPPPRAMGSGLVCRWRTRAQGRLPFDNTHGRAHT